MHELMSKLENGDNNNNNNYVNVTCIIKFACNVKLHTLKLTKKDYCSVEIFVQD